MEQGQINPEIPRLDNQPAPPFPPGGPGLGWGSSRPPQQFYPPPAPPGGGGIFRQHPLLMILLIFLVFAGIFALTAVFIGQKASSGARLGGVPFGKKVAVVEITGVILDGHDVIEDLRRYQDDDSVSAVVLRVDSPGGGVGASQEIHDAVAELAAAKPVVVSMGSVAASGGYYVSCPAQVIFANPGTITGSIGVIMEFTNLEDLMKWMKIHPEVIKSGEFKDTGSAYRPMTEAEQAYLQAFVNDVYEQFVEAVAQGRKMKPEDVKKLADGRIFTGRQAKALKLVDELGPEWSAIHKAAQLGGIKGEPRVLWPMKKRNLLQEMMGGLAPDSLAQGLFPSTIRAMYLLKP